MIEIWKEIAEFPSYKVSNMGRMMNKNGKIMHQFDDGKGYMIVGIWDHNKHYNRRISRLVGLAFLEPIEGCNEINHKNENKRDNRAENLEWCDRLYNVRYGTRTARQVQHAKTRGVIMTDLYGNVIRVYKRQRDTEADGFDSTMVNKCCKGTKKTHRGYKFRYINQ